MKTDIYTDINFTHEGLQYNKVLTQSYQTYTCPLIYEFMQIMR